MKIIFRGETKRAPDFQQYAELVKHASKIFNLDDMEEIGEALKLFYMDEDGDIISLTSQSDLEEAFQVMAGKVRVVMAKTIDEAREALVGGSVAAADALNRSEMLNQSIASIPASNASMPQANTQRMGYGQFGSIGPAAHADLEQML